MIKIKCPICNEVLKGASDDIRGVAASHRMLNHDRRTITPKELNKWREWFERLPPFSMGWKD